MPQVAHGVPPAPGDARYLALTTFRRDGRSVTTPVWPVSLHGRIFVGTTAGSGKVKRLRANPNVRFAPCNHNGSLILDEWREGRAHLVQDGSLRREIGEALKRKYGWIYHLVMLVYRLRGLYRERVVLEIVEPPPGWQDKAARESA